MIVILNVLLAIFAIAAVAVAYVRLSPNPVAVVHLDPYEVGASGSRSAYIGPPEAPVYGVSPEELFAALDEIIRATPKTTKVAEGPDPLHASYIARTPLVGFPDYVSVRVRAAGEGATYAIYSRSRFGRSDLGANAERVAGWRGALADRFGGP